MAKGDSTGIAQQGAQLDPNRFNRFGNPNNPVYGGQAPPMGGSISGPPPGIMEMLMQMLAGQSAPNSRMGNVQQGIRRLRGNQKPENNKTPPRMPTPEKKQSMMPESQMMPGGGQFMMPQPRQQAMMQQIPPQMIGGGMRNFNDPSMGPQMGSGQYMGGQMGGGGNQFLQNPEFLRSLMMGQAGNMRNFG